MRRNSKSVRLRIAKNIRRLRESHDWSQATLAERSNFSEKHIGRLERGESPTSLEGLEDIAAGLECDIAELFVPVPAGRASFIIRESDLTRLEDALKIAVAVRRAARA